jgi:transposase
MKFWRSTTEYQGGVDLHWENMVICILNSDGEKLVHRRLRNDPRMFARVVKPYAHSLTLAVECTGTWYWLHDLCERLAILFVLGHALYMKWIHGSKSKDDFKDSEKMARMLSGGNYPYAYAHPKELRATRDLLRRRSYFVAMRTGMMTHIKTLNAQVNQPKLGNATKSSAKRQGIASLFEDPDMAMSVEADAVTCDFYDSMIAQIEGHVLKRMKEYRSKDLAVLMTMPGVGKILALTIALEIHDINRFPTRQHFCSYARLIHDRHSSNKKVYGTAGHKIGNPSLKWAFGEAAVHALQASAAINAYRQKLLKKHSPGRSMGILAHKLGRATYYMLKNGTAFDEERFLKG